MLILTISKSFIIACFVSYGFHDVFLSILFTCIYAADDLILMLMLTMPVRCLRMYESAFGQVCIRVLVPLPLALSAEDVQQLLERGGACPCAVSVCVGVLVVRVSVVFCIVCVVWRESVFVSLSMFV